MNEALLQTLTQVFRDALLSTEFVVVQEGAERHGSWEWVASNTKYSLNRFVILSVIEEIPDSSDSFETWAGADDNQRYVRLLVSQNVVPSWVLAEQPEQIAASVDQAVARADALTGGDLREAYPFSASG
jgi:hypothetical protein